METYSTVCPRNCYSGCSFKVHVDNGKVVGIDPHPDNLATPEGVCIKGLSYVERANSENRILHPLKKINGKFEPIPWTEALDLISEKLNHFKHNYGNHSIFYLSGSGSSGMVNDFSSAFWKLFGGATTAYGNLCWPAGLEATRLTLGDNKHNNPWDIENAQLIIMWGKNAVETNIQQTIPVNKALDKGAFYVVIDPRYTLTASAAHMLYQIKPGTDAVLALAMAKVIIENNWHDTDFIAKHVHGFEAFASHVQKYTLAYAESITGISQYHIYELAKKVGTTKPMTIVPGYGMQRYTNGGQTIRSILALQVITGNIGKPGACFHYANLQSYVFEQVKEPLCYYPPKEPHGLFRRTIPVALLGEAMLNTANPELKMIWVERGNPLTQNPDTNTILKAFRKLEFRVVVDQFLTDTALEADLVLPAKNMFEQSDLIGSYWNPYVQLKQKVVEPAGEVKPETEIYYLLAQKLGFSQEQITEHLPLPGNEHIETYLKNLVARFPELSWETLQQKPVLAPGLQEVAYSDFVFATPSGKIELYSEQATQLWQVNPLPDYVPLAEDTENPDYPFRMLSPNSKYRIHSQFNNLKAIASFNPEPFVEINPQDALPLGINNGSMVRVYNKRGQVVVKAKFDYAIKPQCLAIHNGWWQTQGGNVNFLSKGRETDMGHGTAFHDNAVAVEPVLK